MGDSVMQQFYSAIACELEREGLWKNPQKFTNTDEALYVRCATCKHKVEIKFLPIYHFVNGRFDRIRDAAMHRIYRLHVTMSHA